MNLKAIQLVDDEKDQVPGTAEARIKELMALPLKQKEGFVPPVGSVFSIGPFVFRVSVVNPSQLRFTATLADVIIKGVNDGSEKVSAIVDPNTGKGIVK